MQWLKLTNWEFKWTQTKLHSGFPTQNANISKTAPDLMQKSSCSVRLCWRRRIKPKLLCILSGFKRCHTKWCVDVNRKENWSHFASEKCRTSKANTMPTLCYLAVMYHQTSNLLMFLWFFLWNVLLKPIDKTYRSQQNTLITIINRKRIRKTNVCKFS